jgi:hypothetical protein
MHHNGAFARNLEAICDARKLARVGEFLGDDITTTTWTITGRWEAEAAAAAGNEQAVPGVHPPCQFFAWFGLYHISVIFSQVICSLTDADALGLFETLLLFEFFLMRPSVNSLPAHHCST